MNAKWTKLLAAGLALGALSGTAAASGHVNFGFYIGAPAPVIAPPVVYTPPPVYYTPPPRVVYAPPVPVYYPAPYYAAPAWGVRYGWGHGYSHRHWH